MKKEEKKSKTGLTIQELQFISQLLFDSRWTVQQTQQVIVPLINKLAKLIDLKKIGYTK